MYSLCFKRFINSEDKRVDLGKRVYYQRTQLKQRREHEQKTFTNPYWLTYKYPQGLNIKKFLRQRQIPLVEDDYPSSPWPPNTNPLSSRDTEDPDDTKPRETTKRQGLWK